MRTSAGVHEAPIWRVNRTGVPGLPAKQFVRGNLDADRDRGPPPNSHFLRNVLRRSRPAHGGPSTCWFEVRPLASAPIRGHSSAGRAVALQAKGRRFDPDWLHQYEGCRVKQTPKSCRCQGCKHSPVRKELHTQEQRAFRRAGKQRLKQGDELLTPAYHGSRPG